MTGGRRSVPEGMVKPWPYFRDEDRAAVQSVMTAPNADEQRRIQAEGLARDWSDYIGVKYCIPTNSGTAALHMAVAGVGTRPGDEIICPAFTFWATAAAVLHHNASPVFVDIEPQTFCMDPTQDRSGDQRAHAGHYAGAYPRHASRHGPHPGDRAPPRPCRDRGRRAGPWSNISWAQGRHAGHLRRIQPAGVQEPDHGQRGRPLRHRRRGGPQAGRPAALFRRDGRAGARAGDAGVQRLRPRLDVSRRHLGPSRRPQSA